MKKRLLSGLLCAALLLTPALAAGSSFPAVNVYPAGYYHDVTEGAWYADAATLCYETGLMTGTAANAFSPDGMVSLAEATAVAARIGSSLDGTSIPAPGDDMAWFAGYLDYLIYKLGQEDPLSAVLAAAPERTATRQEFFSCLAAVVPAEQLAAINSITTLPDTDDADVLRFYNAGILTGTDATGTFSGSKSLTRAECAAMVARIVDPSLRQSFTPAEKPAEQPSLSYEEELMQTEAVRINGTSVNFQQFIQTLNACISETDATLKANYGTGLDWNAKYTGIDDLPAYFKQLALNRLVEDTVISTQARALGCTAQTLPAFLTPDPSKALDNIYCAKHILVDDEQTAQVIIALLQANPSMETFDGLLAQYGTDPGMTSNPNGYLFTDGDMVSEFENAVKAMPPNGFNNVPVKSDFGYHIILRLDPTSYPGWEQAVQEMRYNSYVEQWMASATVTLNSAELDRLDVPGRYAAYVASLGG